MARIKLITDSTSDLTQEEIEFYNIAVIPMKVTIDGEDFDGIDNEEYIYRMRDAKQFSTSQPAVGLFMDAYKKWTEKGYEIISLHVSSALSGTYNTAFCVAQDYKGVHVVDTMTATCGMKYFIKDAYDYIKEGKNVKDIVELLVAKQKKVLTYVTIDKLDNLVRSGRLKKTAGLIGNFLNLKILTKLLPDELVVLDKVRGKKKLVQALINAIKKDVENKKIKTISLVNVLSYEYIDMVREKMLEVFDYQVLDKNIVITTPAVSTHAGEGAVGVMIEVE
ncbi:DegV family protein [Gemella sp. zg-1178]|nr:DegV family protein [Gemella sp. zg-1178]MBU0279319.1 DegV family protein [Gemella sp. zg-1178]QWQ39556.1 DegV family protein [Gemella sp. zg-570]